MKTSPPRTLLLAVVIATVALGATACGTEDIPPGNKGLMFDRSGALALYTGGTGLQTDSILGPGTHYTGLYDEVRDVNCKDENAKETIDVLTKSDLTVRVDLRLTYSADCTSPEQIVKVLDQVGATGQTVEATELYSRYIVPIVRESLRNRLAEVTIEDVKTVREELRNAIVKDLETSIAKRQDPVIVKILTVSDIILPDEIIQKNREIELARQEAEKEREMQVSSKFRLERELFEEQEQRKVIKERAEREKEKQEIDAERDKQIAILHADAILEGKRREAEGIRAVRAELTGPYLDYLRVLKDNEVRMEMARSMGAGTIYFLDKDFIVPPGSASTVSVQR